MHKLVGAVSSQVTAWPAAIVAIFASKKRDVGLLALLIPADPGCQAGRSTDSAPPHLLNPVPDAAGPRLKLKPKQLHKHSEARQKPKLDSLLLQLDLRRHGAEGRKPSWGSPGLSESTRGPNGIEFELRALVGLVVPTSVIEFVYVFAARTRAILWPMHDRQSNSSLVTQDFSLPDLTHTLKLQTPSSRACP